MKSIGIVRRLDTLGRIVFPKELRRNMQIETGTPLEILVDGDKIVLKKYNPACSLCKSDDEVVNFNNRYICKKCIEDIKAAENI